MTEGTPTETRNGIRVCFCDLKGRPYDDWDAHQGFCLMLDWAMANGKITPDYFLSRLSGAQAGLGITDAELAAEALTMPSFDEAAHQVLRSTLGPPAYSAWSGRAYRTAEIPRACYRSEYGFMVHVKGECRC